jgi:mutator protein MutT
MFAVGAIIELIGENKILLLKRSDNADYSPGIWEDITGRVHQFEEPEDALRREIAEEAGIEVEIQKPLTTFHLFRGEKSADTELIGIIYYCTTDNPHVKISGEHTEYLWTTPQEALTRVTHPGVKKDIERYLEEIKNARIQKNKKPKKGIDYIGSAIGVLMFNDKGEVFLSKRSQNAKNERGCWEMPGGSVDFGETLEETAKREVKEEFGVDIDILHQFKAENHFIPQEGQHWITTSFHAQIKEGQEPHIMEPEKCDAIGWFALNALPQPLSIISKIDIEEHIPLLINEKNKE